ncbi:hypothetical protein ACKI1Q_45915, partial [Streptomyces galilaeus]|uniref:hypothetical protein n=1 Tax=Streptomyces galilaeus TaxID=33899 RepID=UPI0038F6ACD8
DAMQDARAELSRIRADLAEWASDHGVVAAGSGTPFRTGADGALHAAPRYVQIARDIAGLAPEHQINGMHVGVANDADA